TSAESTPPAPPPRSSKGAIGAVSRSIADLKSRSVIEIDPFLIEAGGVQDRLESDPDADADLARSIAEYGQQVPVLVRPHPEKDGRYQIVYGRRRVIAMRDLNQPVKALVRDLDDTQLIMAQGQENTARRDLSFIEKVNFARQMDDAGYSRKVICDALSIDKTLISRMMSVAVRIPPEVIARIGSAHGIGRDRWLEFATLMEKTDVDEDWLIAMLNVSQDITGEGRVEFLMDWMTRKLTGINAAEAAPPPKPLAPGPKPVFRSVKGADGEPLGEARQLRNAFVLRLSLQATRGFEEWLLAELPHLHATWRASKDD
ncbi:MAG: plasmid partitioning protein RepB, partial [Rhodobacteraceae bacterium PARR1]